MRIRPSHTKVSQDQEPKELTEEWRAGARRWLEGVKKIRLDKRIYEDETGQSLRTKLRNEGEHGGEHPSFERDRSLRQKVHVACVRKAELHWDLSDRNTKEIDVLQLMRWER